jgi:hypothetical protein
MFESNIEDFVKYLKGPLTNGKVKKLDSMGHVVVVE